MTAASSIAGGPELGLVLRATMLIGAAWVAAAMLRKARASAATRHMAWLLGIAALLALPLIWWLMPPLRLPILEPEAVSAFAPPAAAAAAAPSAAPGLGTLLVAIYLLGVAALLLRFALSRRLVSRLWRDAEPAGGAAWQDLLSGAARELGVSRPVALRIARGPALPMTWGPMTWGTLAPRILLPAEAHEWAPDRRRHVLLHELAHVARRDSFSRSAASLACALYWFHPGAWFAARRMCLEQEYAADDRVLNAGAPARHYARSLLDLALRAGGRSSPDHAAAMAGMCQIERRVVSITTPARRERPGLPFLSAAVAIGTCVMLVVATGVPVRPVTAPSGLPGIETAADTGVAPAPAEGLSEQTPESGTAAARREDRPQDIREGLETQRTAAAQAEGRVRETPGQAIEPSAQAPAGAPLGGAVIPDSPPPPQRLAVYGPQLPQPLPAEQESDPRIPAALRRGNIEPAADRRAGPGPPRNAGERLLRTLPTALLESARILNPG